MFWDTYYMLVFLMNLLRHNNRILEGGVRVNTNVEALGDDSLHAPIQYLLRVNITSV